MNNITKESNLNIEKRVALLRKDMKRMNKDEFSCEKLK